MPDQKPGPLIGSGRAADVFDIGAGRVLRRNRDGSSTEREADVMRHLHARGFPVPEVFESDGPDLVLERVVAPTMLDAFARRPWRLRAWARQLASLHRHLEAVPVHDVDLPARFGEPEVIVHADFHPDNVMLADHGPVVIDWSNACLGARGTDVASTWIIVATSELDTTGATRVVQSAARSRFLKAFLADSDLERARRQLAVAGAHRLDDRNVRAGERADIRELLRAEAV